MKSFKNICRLLSGAAFAMISFSGLAAEEVRCSMAEVTLSASNESIDVSVIGDMHLAGLSIVKEFKTNLRETLPYGDLDDDAWEWAGGFIVYFDILPDFSIADLKFHPQGLNESIKTAVVKGIQAIDFSKFKTIGNYNHAIRLIAKIDLIKLAHGLE